MDKSKFRGRGLQLVFSFLVVVGFGFLGVVVGIVLGYFLWLYVIPPWSSVEINRDGMVIVEIVGADVIGLGSGKENDEIEVIFKTVVGILIGVGSGIYLARRRWRKSERNV